MQRLILLTLISAAVALTPEEVTQFKARTHTEKNTGVQGTVSITEEGDYYRIRSNGIPDHDTGTFPAPSNPNSIKVKNYNYRIPKDPQLASSTTCMPMGPLAFALNGVAIFSPYGSNGGDAVVSEVYDDCQGHPTEHGDYHYHYAPVCVAPTSTHTLVGVALDGFPIYGMQDETGRDLTSDDLDECHGRMVDGVYRYHLTEDFPYILGCYKGTPSPDIPARKLSASSCRYAASGSSTAYVTSGVLAVASFVALTVCLL